MLTELHTGVRTIQTRPLITVSRPRCAKKPVVSRRAKATLSYPKAPFFSISTPLEVCDCHMRTLFLRIEEQLLQTSIKVHLQRKESDFHSDHGLIWLIE